jgi:hypothetical protein
LIKPTNSPKDSASTSQSVARSESTPTKSTKDDLHRKPPEFDDEYGSEFADDFAEYSDDEAEDDWDEGNEEDSEATLPPPRGSRNQKSRSSGNGKKSNTKPRRQEPSRPAWLLPAIIGGGIVGIGVVVTVLVIVIGGDSEPENQLANNDQKKTTEGGEGEFAKGNEPVANRSAGQVAINGNEQLADQGRFPSRRERYCDSS